MIPSLFLLIVKCLRTAKAPILEGISSILFPDKSRVRKAAAICANSGGN